MGVRFGHPGKLEFSGVVMPLDLGLAAPTPNPTRSEVASSEERSAELLAERDRLKAERDDLARRVDELAATLAALAGARIPTIPGTE